MSDRAAPPAGRVVAVVVPTRLERVRLLWLLDALLAQDLAADAFEVVLATDAVPGARFRAAVLDHPLLREGRARLLQVPRPATAGASRNAAWRACDAGLVAFCDDDTRPPPSWLRLLVDRARAEPGAVVQGAVRIDEDERLVADRAPHRHLLTVDPPTFRGETANVLYPRDVLERLDGFDPSWAVCEDTELACRAHAAGVRWVAAPQAWTRHGVQEETLVGALRRAGRYGAAGRLVAVHPAVREHLPGRVLWAHTHARALGLLAAVGAAAALRRRPVAALAALGGAAPFLSWHLGRYGPGPRGRARAAAEAPQRLLLDLVEVAAVSATAARHRTVLL